VVARIWLKNSGKFSITYAAIQTKISLQGRSWIHDRLNQPNRSCSHNSAVVLKPKVNCMKKLFALKPSTLETSLTISVPHSRDTHSLSNMSRSTWIKCMCSIVQLRRNFPKSVVQKNNLHNPKKHVLLENLFRVLCRLTSLHVSRDILPPFLGFVND